ncbi:four helix bundle protein [Marinifilum breve]|uniref:Four helix bundle protein n=1 Tax=Marinifilum breve TaxID=2184082 RepID=A0A2V4A425_9BACT|nr:four helix bundle protein [Marinifilum breve]PXY03003.1 four helix bundle protein [Marinifilum breve]
MNCKFDLQERLFNFSISIVNEYRKLPISNEYTVISHQVLKSATSIGANFEEAQAAVSKADFTNKVAISLKEARETNYWIRIIIAISDVREEWIKLEKESKEIIKILASIYNKTVVKK